MCSFAIGLQLFLDSPGISTPQQSENELTTLIFGRRRCGMRCEVLIVREIGSNFEIHQFSALRALRFECEDCWVSGEMIARGEVVFAPPESVGETDPQT